MDARLKVGELRPRRWRRLNDAVSFTVDVKMDKPGEFFELLLRLDADPDLQVLDLRPVVRHWLLLCKEVHDPKRHNRRKNDGFVRQGKRFFVPFMEMEVDDSLELNNEPLRRGGLHVAELLIRRGGTTTRVCRQYPNGLTGGEYAQLVCNDSGRAKFRWRTMSRDPQVFVKDRIRHSDHRKMVFLFWHRVLPIEASFLSVFQNVVFMD